jgi:hypothetical protein
MSDLRSTLRDLAHDDARRATDASARATSRLLGEIRARHAQSKGARVARSFGFALAATLVLALAVPLWMVSRSGSRGVLSGSGSRVAGDRAPEVATAFLPLPYSSIPTRDAQIVRIEVPRAALGTFGLLPADGVGFLAWGSAVPAAAPALGRGTAIHGTVVADVIVGEDGLARAVRFVRAPIARTE